LDWKRREVELWKGESWQLQLVTNREETATKASQMGIEVASKVSSATAILVSPLHFVFLCDFLLLPSFLSLPVSVLVESGILYYCTGESLIWQDVAISS
jgi:hypothetical protein